MPDTTAAREPGTLKAGKKASWGTARNGTELTDGLLDAMAKEYEEGTWSGHTGEIRSGKPCASTGIAASAD